MENWVRDIGIIAVTIFICVSWWFHTNEPTSRKYIILWGSSILATGVVYIIAKSFDIPALGILIIIGLISVVIFFIKLIQSERRAKRKSLDDT